MAERRKTSRKTPLKKGSKPSGYVAFNLGRTFEFVKIHQARLTEIMGHKVGLTTTARHALWTFYTKHYKETKGLVK